MPDTGWPWLLRRVNLAWGLSNFYPRTCTVYPADIVNSGRLTPPAVDFDESAMLRSVKAPGWAVSIESRHLGPALTPHSTQDSVVL